MKKFVKEFVEASHWFVYSLLFIVLSILILLAWGNLLNLSYGSWGLSLVDIGLFILGSYVFVHRLNILDQKTYRSELKYGKHVYVSFPIYDKYFFYVLFFHIFYIAIIFISPLSAFYLIMPIPVAISIYRSIIKPKKIFPAY